MKHLRAQFIKGATGTLLLKITSTGLGFITALILARVLSAAGYGSYAYAMAWVGLLGLPATLGFHQLLVRNVAVYQTQQKWELLHGLLQFSNRIVLITSMLLMAGAALLGWVLLRSKDDSFMLFSLWIALLGLPFLALTQLRQSAMRGFQQIILGQLPEMLIRPLLLLVSITGAYFFLRQYLSAPLVVALNVVATIIAFGIGAYWLQKVVPNKVKIAEPKYEARAWVSSAVPFLLIGSFQIINSQTDVIMLGMMKTTSEVGIYKLASQIAWLITMVLMSINTVLAPSIASLWVSKNLLLLQRVISRTAQYTFVMSLSIWIVLVILGKRVLSTIGVEFVQGYKALVILSTGLLLCTVAAAVGLLLLMTEYEKDSVWLFGFAAMMNVILNAILIPKYSINGAAFATSISTLIMNISAVVLVRRRLGINPTMFYFKE